MSVGGNTQRYLLFHEYKGTAFFGWQRQPSGKTVQGAIEDALSKFMQGAPVVTTGSSRTDTGVHSLGNTCHVDLTRTSRKGDKEAPPHSAETVAGAVNHFLQKMAAEVRITRCIAVPADFHARHDACGRTYRYRMIASNKPPSIFEANTAWHIRVRVLDELTVRCVGSDGAQWHPWHPSNRGDISQHLVITARSRSFLYHQVRLMVGALKAVGSGELQVKQLRSILEACNITCLRARMAPAEGLYLVQVHYPSASVEGPGPPRQPSSSAGDAPGQS